MKRILLKLLLILFSVWCPILGHAEDTVTKSDPFILVIKPKPNPSKPRKPAAISTITCEYNDGLLEIDLPWVGSTGIATLYHQNALIGIETITYEENVIVLPISYAEIDIELQLDNGFTYIGTIDL